MGRPTEYTLPKSDQLLIAFWDQVEAARDRYGEVRAVQLLTQALTNLNQSLERNHTPMSTDNQNVTAPFAPFIAPGTNVTSERMTQICSLLQEYGPDAILRMKLVTQAELDAVTQNIAHHHHRLTKTTAIVREYGLEEALKEGLISPEDAKSAQATLDTVRSWY